MTHIVLIPKRVEDVYNFVSDKSKATCTVTAGMQINLRLLKTEPSITDLWVKASFSRTNLVGKTYFFWMTPKYPISNSFF